MKTTSPPILLPVLLSLLPSCDNSTTAAAAGSARDAKGTAVLLVSHGSRSHAWREMLFDLERGVRDSVLESPDVDAVETAFMEYTEPSIATRLEEFDKAGYANVVMVPLFLTVSSHPFDDIPTIIGAKDDAVSRETLVAEGIRRYTPRAQVEMTPLLDFPAMLNENLERRVRALISEPAKEGVVLVAYGSGRYEREWSALLEQAGERLIEKLGVGMVNHAWCGHIVHYETESTVTAIEAVLEKHESALVVPVLVAFDEMFQGGVIADAVKEVDAGERVRYVPDAILPDPDLENWVIQIAHETAKNFGSPAQAKD